MIKTTSWLVTWREMPTFAPIHSFEIYMIKEFFSLLKRYMKPYRKYLTWAVILNFLSQWLNVFSFAALVPILNILFKIDTTKYEYMPMDIHHWIRMSWSITDIISSIILLNRMGLLSL